MKVFLETDRLTLREFEPPDDGFLIELDSDPEVMRFLSDGKPSDPDFIRAVVMPRVLQYHAAYDHFGTWVAIERWTGAEIGWFHFRPAQSIAEGIELGYRLRRSAWNQGYATEGSRALIELGFSRLGLRRVIAKTMKENARSRHVMEKLGMTFEKEYLDDVYPGMARMSVQYALSRDQWSRRGVGS